MFNKRNLTNPPSTRSTCEEDLKLLEAAVAYLINSNASLRQENAKLNAEISVLESNYNNVQADLNASDNIITNLNLTIEDLRAQVVSLMNENNKLQNDLNAEKAKVTTLTNDKNKLQADLNAANATISSLNGQVSSLTADKNKLEAEKNKLNADLKDANATISSLNGQVTTLTNDKNKLQADLNDANTNLNNANTTISSLNSQVTTLTQNVSLLRNAINYYNDLLANFLQVFRDNSKSLIVLGEAVRMGTAFVVKWTYFGSIYVSIGRLGTNQSIISFREGTSDVVSFTFDRNINPTLKMSSREGKEYAYIEFDLEHIANATVSQNIKSTLLVQNNVKEYIEFRDALKALFKATNF